MSSRRQTDSMALTSSTIVLRLASRRADASENESARTSAMSGRIVAVAGTRALSIVAFGMRFATWCPASNMPTCSTNSSGTRLQIRRVIER
jgi:hypothetical protein